MPELPHSHGHSHGHSHEDGKKCNSHDHSTTVDTAPKASTSTGTCGHSHSHGHSHGHDHDSKDATNKEELDSSVCLAVVRENGSEVVLFDATGSPRVFSQEDVNKGSSKLCFSSHGVDGVDSMLTPCFDEEGRHGVPDEGCFCGVETPHLHAHVHDPKRCEQEDAAKETTCASKKKKNSNGEDDFSYLSKLTLHPTDEKSQSTGKEQLVSMGVSERLPKQCNSKDLKRELVDRGMNDRGNGRHRRIHKVQHDDHVDYLVHNAETDGLHLEHPCEDCDDDDVHGNFNLVGKRRLMDDTFQLHFFEVASTPFSVVDYFKNVVFNPNTDRVLATKPICDCKACCATPKQPCCSSKKTAPVSTTPGKKPCCASKTCGANKKQGAPTISKGDNTSDTTVRSSFNCKRICCSSEVPMINSILEPIKGVSNIMINVPVKTVYVDHDPRFVLATDLENVLNKGKFGATLLQDGGTTIATSSAGRSHFFVDKICCASEIPAILSIVEPLPGVSKVSISVTTKMVYVNHTTKVITANEICDALNNDAFGAHIKHDAADDMKDTLSVVVASTLIYDEELKDEKAVRSLLQEMDSFKVYEYVLDTSAKKIRVSHNPNFVTAESLVQDLVQALGLKTTILTDGVDNMKWIIPDIKEEEVPEEERVRPNPYVVFSGIFWIISMLSFIGGNWDYLKYVGCISVAFGIPTIASKAFRTLRRYQFDANCMMLFATLGALGLQEFVEAAAITFLFSISEWLEVRATTRARMALSEIVNLRPDRANLVHPVTKEIVEVPAAAVPVGALVSVKFGDKIPCDGVVFEGQSTVNESSLTGESRPVPKGVNASVSGGTINTGTTALMIRTTCTVENSAVARLIRLVEEAQANRSPTEKLVDEFARRYTPVVILAALCMVTIPWAVSKEMGRLWTHNGLVLIIVACPCALIISTPVSYVAGLAATAQRGIIIKGGAHLEALGLVKKIAFDKTGTLTKGDFALLHLDVVGENRTREEVLQHLSKMEETAAHPLSQALVAAAKNEEVNIPKTMRLSNHVHLDGEGVTAQVNGKEVYVGNERLFRRLGLFDSLPTDKQKTVEEWTSLGGTIGYMSIEGDGIVCAYCVADAIRPEAAEVVAELQKLNIDCQMLTGDRKEAALKIGSMIGLSEEHVMSQLLPEDKLRLVEEMKKENGSSGGSVLTSCGRTAELVLFCGDGVNDAPAMATADIGVAMGAGAALAMETSDVTLLDSHLTKLVYSITMGRRVIRKIKENVIFSLAAKAIVVGFALVGKVDLWAAIATDVGAMLIVTLNGMLLLPASKKASKPSLENLENIDAESALGLTTEGKASTK